MFRTGDLGEGEEYVLRVYKRALLDNAEQHIPLSDPDSDEFRSDAASGDDSNVS